MKTPSDAGHLDDPYLERAAELALASVAVGGGPFGALLVLEGQIVGEGSNSVTLQADPTAHAEVLAIRNACRKLETHDLSGAVLYTSCEPCPMCLGAAYWARVGRIVFASDRRDAAAIGFDDEFIYAELARPLEERQLPCEKRDNARARQAFEAWRTKADRLEY